MSKRYDVTVRDEGSVFLFTPLTKPGKKWFSENVHTEAWQWLGPSLGVDTRFADDLLCGMESDGLHIRFC